MSRWISLLCLGLLVGCAKPELAETPVRASSPTELSAFRAELGHTFGFPQLAAFDTALQELQLAAMDRFPSAAERAAAMREQVNGKSVRAVELLGWEARQTRLQGEIAQMSATLERDLQTRARLNETTSLTVTNRIQNVQDILAKLRVDLAATQNQLSIWRASAATR